MLRITAATDPITVTRINLCLYGQPGIGKTSLAFTAENPLLLDFDLGAHRASNRKDVVRVNYWADVVNIAAEDLNDYSTVVVDTAGRALDSLTTDIIRRNPKAGYGGALTRNGYGTLKAEFIAWLKMINGFGKDIILVAHMDEQRNGEETIERLDVQGGSKGEIYKAADAMGRILIEGGKRWLNFSPTDTAFGKNPGQFELLEIPHPDRDPAFLAGVIATIKSRMNALNAAQIQAQAVLEGWRNQIAELNTAEDFNNVLPQAKDAPKAAQAMFNEAAKVLGFAYDKNTGKYLAKPDHKSDEKVLA